MPRLETSRRIASAKNNGAKTIGQIHKEESDWYMEATWDNDIQSKICYIYDYFHDDQPKLNTGMTYRNTAKTKIDAKFIIKSYQSMDKDQVEYYIQFKPSQKVRFDKDDELYYFETDYRRKYGVQDFPIGMFVDIPDDTGVYRKWLVCKKEYANQFVKYIVLPCDYYLTWIERNGNNRIERGMWCVQRQQNSYTIGVYRDRYFEHPDNQTKLLFELNTITEKFWYNTDLNKTMRLIVGAPTDNPLTWSITKVENSNPIGIQKLTLYQDFYNPHTDKIVKDENGNIIAMYADYYDSSIDPISSNISEHHLTPSKTYGRITAFTSNIKVGGSYKTLSIKIYDSNDNEITDRYSDAIFNWSCYLDERDKTTDLSAKVTWRNGTTFNQKKIKFPNDRTYLGKNLNVKCEVIKDGSLIETISQFELIIL